jgi:hypothetical protein
MMSKFWIRNIMVQIQLRVSDQWILLISLLTFKPPKKTIFRSFSAYYFLNVHLNHFSKIKSHKEVTKSRNQGFPYFCLMIEESGSVPLTNGS